MARGAACGGHQKSSQYMKRWIGILSLLWLSFAFNEAAAQEPERYEVNFVNTEITEFIDSVSRITGITFIVDPKVKGPVTVRSAEPVTSDQLYGIFLAQLRAQGYAAVDLPNGHVKIVSDQVARLEPVPVDVGDIQVAGAGSDGMATRVFSVRNAGSEQLLNVLKPLVDPRVGVVTPYPSANLLVVTDWRSNLSRISDLLREVDQVSNEPLEVLPVQHARAKELAPLANQLLAKNPATTQAQVLADPRTNTLLVRGNAEARTQVKAMLRQLDTPREPSGNTQVFYLRHANAADVLKVLRGLAQESQAPTESAGESTTAATSPAQALVTANGVRMEAEEGTNALIMMGPDNELATYKNIIERLDIRRAQVMVEAIIAEVSENRARELGVQWLFLDQNGSTVPVGSINFTNSSGGASINSLAAAALSDDTSGLGDILSGMQGSTFGIGNLGSGINFVTLVNAIKTETGFNLLSTPTLSTLDNAEASIMVGQEVPFITGSVTQDNSNPYQTIERKEVGVKLRIRPQITIDNTVRMDIVQEVSSLTDSSLASDVITNKREIKTTVMVEDSGVVVLGGLISDEASDSDQRVPWLGDLPVVGQLFRSASRSQLKQNLMVFIRPRIVRDPQSLAQLSTDKYQHLKSLNPQLPAMPEGTSLLNLFPPSRARLGTLELP
ncbi:general secretion pathway protein D [Azomonas agilis]|uniref:General secretion pathway protein D n=2 Tax=Azomonas agilis TaxID=116849 RepID=A0A562IKP1_9GAMM|nr:general secretion pathway protein D [Azomonas agilis]